MNLERGGFPTPQNGNQDSRSFVTRGTPIPHESRIGHSQGLWVTTSGRSGIVGDGDTPRRPIPMENGSESWTRIPMGNAVFNNGNPSLERTVLQRNGITQNTNGWKSVVPGNSVPQRNEISTPEKLVHQRSNTVPVDRQEKQSETNNWQDLLGMYTGLLKEPTSNTNEVLENINPTPPSKIHDHGNQIWVTSTNKNVTPRPSPSPYQNQASNQSSMTSVPYLNTNEPTNWNANLLASIVGPSKSSTSISQANEPQNNGIHGSNRSAIPNLANQVESNSMRSSSWTSMLGGQQSSRFNSNNPINNVHNTQDGFPVAYQPRYNPSSPPRSERDTSASSIIDSFPFAPITPDSHGKYIHGQRVVPENGNFRVEEISTPQKDQHANQTASFQEAENIYNELLQTIGDSPSSAISSTQKEHGVVENMTEQGIDLNKTPQQKTPARRRKHRPKVIREGKQKRTRKPNGTPNEIRVKRKYVRRKGLNVSETQEDNVTKKTPVGSTGKRKYVRRKSMNTSETQQGDVAASAVETPAKSCKKQLNFDSEPVTQDESQHGININDETPIESCKKKLNFDLEHVPQDASYDIRSSQQGIKVNNNVNPQDVGQEVQVNGIHEKAVMQSGTQHASLSELAKAKHHALNMLARNMTVRNSVPEQDRRDNMYNNMNRVHGEGIGSIVLQRATMPANLERTQEPNLVNVEERRGVKRLSPEQMRLNANAVNSFLMYQRLLVGMAHRSYNHSNSNGIFLESNKKTKMENQFQAITPHKPRLETGQMNGIYRNGSPVHLLTSGTQRVNQAMIVGQNVNRQQFRPPMVAAQYLQKHQMLTGMQHHGIRPILEKSQNCTQSHEIGSKTAVVSWNLPPTTPSKDQSRYAVTTYPATPLEKRQNAKPNPYNQRLNGLVRHQHTPLPRGRPRKQKAEFTVDDLTYRLEGLHIYDGNRNGQNELVLYRGGGNAMIPFEPIKKRIPRPKVDLDPETDRLWKLLMGKEGSESTESLEKGKEKWWEEERRVFRGRADSFIARMHLVQGDRRFSRWKGSVVDSVIGVFLTQNVSDHLSSSAFMSLAAKFPPKPSTANDTCCQDEAYERPIEVTELDDTIKCHDKIEQPVSSISSENTHQISEEVVLSQDSFDSTATQIVDEIRSSSGSNSEAEEVATGFETTKLSKLSVMTAGQEEKPDMYKDQSCHDSWTTLLDEPKTSTQHLPKELECNMQFPRMNGVDLNSFHLQQESHVSSSQHQTSMGPGPQKDSLLHFGVVGGESTSNSGMTEAYHTMGHGGTQKNVNSPSKQDSFMFGGMPSLVDKQICFENTVPEAKAKEQSHGSHEPPGGTGTNMPKSRKQVAEDEKNRAMDWDSLRKEALSRCGKKEKNKDAADSLDYEALRRAHVSEISDAIRERGMNNLLADRMKDFLDRLVRDHGKIDLEWLRDAPPDKAKEYLLSIRGLGLKSVECVRLLTLHHLAFPVDTNVGRIAVRLGWVPLQPLPESLQLHLLEMYPVLESIQKYLWPRLCKLDQLTLYELHYQMITFGKVFCTKSKPNCNACPMRAECRHFASAFASARLSLPGPEEKRIVTSDAPVATDPVPPVVIRPLSLPQPEYDMNKSEKSFERNCEPIIEEPKTPEPEVVELSISDIEDQYYEDSDEIPSIKLNMEEFTTNLQSIMQDSKELQDDMSKALVALNPNAASIPTPKLKDVSRLRTEHQVYELPDSHQLLEGFDRREPDDPSPYLLAIWTPGETANSVQPPERECLAQQFGKLCDRTTCFSCNNIKEANSQVVRGTILIPCRTAMRGSFPLNGTYFQVNEMFADHASSMNPIDVPRMWIWNLPRRTVYFGTSVSTIFKGLSTGGIQYCFWKGFVCVRGFDRKSRAPRPLLARLHFPASKVIQDKKLRQINELENKI